MVRDFGLTKESRIGLRLRKKNMIVTGATMHMCRITVQQFANCFKEEQGVVCCSDLVGLMNEFGIVYKKEWTLLIDSCKTIFEAVL